MLRGKCKEDIDTSTHCLEQSNPEQQLQGCGTTGTHSLLVINGSATLEGRLAISYKTKHSDQKSHSLVFPQSSENLCPHKIPNMGVSVVAQQKQSDW